MDLLNLSIALVGSFIAGGINTLAGNGSAITLTILTEVLGLSANLANGTNRIGVFTQTAASTYGFYRSGKLHLQRSRFILGLIILGAIAGLIVATRVSNEQFHSVFRFMMVFMLIIILVKPERWLRETDLNAKLPLWVSIPAFLALGFYGGFIQMGMGIFFLAVMVLAARYSLLDSNIIKSFVIGIYTLVGILIFQYSGLIHWTYGIVMAVGQSLGGYLTAIYASRHKDANRWAHRLLVIMVVASIIKLFNLHKILF